MAKPEILERKFGLFAIKKGYATKDQIKKALNDQKNLKSTNKDKLIGEILVDENIITPEQRDEILRLQKKYNGSSGKDRKQTTTGQPKENPEEKTRTPDDIQVGKKVQDDSGFLLTITEDRIEAFISPIEENLPEVSIDSIKNLLAKEGIKNGIAEDSEISAYLASGLSKDKLWQIAQGKAPDPGKPPEIKYHFDTNPLKVATVDADGNIDYKDRGEIPQFNPGDLLAEIIPEVEGKPGIDIYGEVAAPPAHDPVEILCGAGVKKIEEGTKVVAEINGRAELSNDGTVLISEELVISGDVGVETGHITFDGHIKVKGAVQEGYRINSKTLTADEILKAEITTSGDIIVSKGIIGAKILTDGSIKAKHIRDTAIDALGDIRVEREIFESRIETNGALLLERGTILGSTISAMKGIEAAEIGSHAATPSKLTIGIDNRLEKIISGKKTQIKEKQKQKEVLTSELEKIKDIPETLSDEIGKKAQEQDLAMVKGRTLKQTLQSLQKANDRPNIIKVLKIIKGLNARLETIQTELDEFLKKQEQTEEDIVNKQKQLKELDTEIEELEDDINSLLEVAKLRKSTAIVKATGTIYDRTTIKGLHASMTIKENTKRAIVQETKIPSESSDNEWVMAVSSF